MSDADDPDLPPTPERSFLMGRIRGKNTTPELRVRRKLHALGLRFRLHARELPGRPDIVLPRWKTVVFVHGCFWHRHEGCRLANTPKTRRAFWTNKFEMNVARDERNRSQLARDWRVIIIWECETRDTATLGCRLEALFPRTARASP